MSKPTETDISDVRVPLLQVVAWVLGVGGFFAGAVAFLAWGWLSGRVSDLENGVSTPMARTTVIKFQQVDRELDRLAKDVEACKRGE